jgi:hypothetical protein
MKALEFLDDDKKITIPLFPQELPNNNAESKPNVVESLFEFMDELFNSVFMKNYHENVKKNK